MAENRLGTHWDDCWRIHHSCAIALVEKLQTALQPECEELGCHDGEPYEDTYLPGIPDYDRFNRPSWDTEHE